MGKTSGIQSQKLAKTFCGGIQFELLHILEKVRGTLGIWIGITHQAAGRTSI